MIPNRGKLGLFQMKLESPSDSFFNCLAGLSRSGTPQIPFSRSMILVRQWSSQLLCEFAIQFLRKSTRKMVERKTSNGRFRDHSTETFGILSETTNIEIHKLFDGCRLCWAI